MLGGKACGVFYQIKLLVDYLLNILRPFVKSGKQLLRLFKKLFLAVFALIFAEFGRRNKAKLYLSLAKLPFVIKDNDTENNYYIKS